jgi:hypothetical protein
MERVTGIEPAQLAWKRLNPKNKSCVIITCHAQTTLKQS